MKSVYKWQITSSKWAYLTDAEGTGSPFITGQTITEDYLIAEKVNALSAQEYQTKFEALREVLDGDEDGKKIDLLPYYYYFNVEGDSCVGEAKEVECYKTVITTNKSDNETSNVYGYVVKENNNPVVYLDFTLPRGPQGVVGNIKGFENPQMTFTQVSGETAGVSFENGNFEFVMPRGVQGKRGPQGIVGERGNLGSVEYFDCDCDEGEPYDRLIIDTLDAEDGNGRVLQDVEEMRVRFYLPKGSQGLTGEGNVQIMSLNDYMALDSSNTINSGLFYAITGYTNDGNTYEDTGIYLGNKLIMPSEYINVDTSITISGDVQTAEFPVYTNLANIIVEIGPSPNFIQNASYDASRSVITLTISQPNTGNTNIPDTIIIRDGSRTPFLFNKEKTINIVQSPFVPKFYVPSQSFPVVTGTTGQSIINFNVDANIFSGDTPQVGFAVYKNGDWIPSGTTIVENSFRTNLTGCTYGFRYSGQADIGIKAYTGDTDSEFDVIHILPAGETDVTNVGEIQVTRNKIVSYTVTLDYNSMGSLDGMDALIDSGVIRVDLYIGKYISGFTFSPLCSISVDTDALYRKTEPHDGTITFTTDTQISNTDRLCIYTSNDNGQTAGGRQYSGRGSFYYQTEMFDKLDDVVVVSSGIWVPL